MKRIDLLKELLNISPQTTTKASFIHTIIDEHRARACVICRLVLPTISYIGPLLLRQGHDDVLLMVLDGLVSYRQLSGAENKAIAVYDRFVAQHEKRVKEVGVEEPHPEVPTAENSQSEGNDEELMEEPPLPPTLEDIPLTVFPYVLSSSTTRKQMALLLQYAGEACEDLSQVALVFNKVLIALVSKRQVNLIRSMASVIERLVQRNDVAVGVLMSIFRVSHSTTIVDTIVDLAGTGRLMSGTLVAVSEVIGACGVYANQVRTALTSDRLRGIARLWRQPETQGVRPSKTERALRINLTSVLEL